MLVIWNASLILRQNIGERSKNIMHLYAALRSNNIKLQTSEGKFQGLRSEANGRVNFYKYTAMLDNEEIFPLNGRLNLLFFLFYFFQALNSRTAQIILSKIPLILK